jgi:chromosome segregation ATPase
MSSHSQTPSSLVFDQYQDLVQYQQAEIERLNHRVQELQIAVDYWKEEGWKSFQHTVRSERELQWLRPALREALNNYQDEKKLRVRLEEELKNMRADLDLCLRHEQKWKQQAERAEEEIDTLKVGQQLLSTLVVGLRQEIEQVRAEVAQRQSWRQWFTTWWNY